MNKKEKIKKLSMMLITVLCMIILSFTIVTFSLKIIANHYLNKGLINKTIDNININDLFKDEAGKELEEFLDIKNKIVDSGIPSELINDFIDTKPVHNFTNDVINDSIDSTLYDKKVKKYDADYLYSYIEDNIGTMSEELQEKNAPKSELLTEEKQQEILHKLKDKMPSIEEKINKIEDKIGSKLDGKLIYIKKSLHIMKFLCTTVIDVLLIIISGIFVFGIIISRKNIIRSLKYIGISFIISSGLLLIIKSNIPKIYNKINDASSLIGNYMKLVLDY